MRATLLVNPFAGQRCEAEPLADRIRSWGWDLSVERTHVHDAAEQARSAAEHGVDLVIGAGGDGTLHHLANGLAGSRTALGVIPCGTGNDLARSMGIPLELDPALEVLREARTRSIDLGTVNGRYFLNVLSMGLGVRVALGATPEQKRRWGRLAYYAKTLQAFRNRSAMPLTLRIDGVERHVSAWQLSVANGNCFGGGWSVSPEASLEDRTLDVVVVEPMAFWRWIRLGLARQRGLAGSIGSMHYRARHLVIDGMPRTPFNADGEVYEVEMPLRVAIAPAALKLVAP